MLIELLLSFVVKVLDKLIVFEIPFLPLEVYNYIETLFTYLESGASVLANYTPLPYLLTLFGIIVTIDAALILYKFIMWVLNKIPMLDID